MSFVQYNEITNTMKLSDRDRDGGEHSILITEQSQRDADRRSSLAQDQINNLETEITPLSTKQFKDVGVNENSTQVIITSPPYKAYEKVMVRDMKSGGSPIAGSLDLSDLGTTRENQDENVAEVEVENPMIIKQMKQNYK